MEETINIEEYRELVKKQKDIGEPVYSFPKIKLSVISKKDAKYIFREKILKKRSRKGLDKEEEIEREKQYNSLVEEIVKWYNFVDYNGKGKISNKLKTTLKERAKGVCEKIGCNKNLSETAEI